jgi:hypothetical protein
MTTGLLLGSALFVIGALAASRNVLFLPAVLLAAAAAANAFL